MNRQSKKELMRDVMSALEEAAEGEGTNLASLKMGLMRKFGVHPSYVDGILRPMLESCYLVIEADEGGDVLRKHSSRE